MSGGSTGCAVLAAALLCSCGKAPDMTAPSEDRVRAARARTGAMLKASLEYADLAPGCETMLLAFKEEREIEAWGRRFDGAWKLWKTFPVCAASGVPGPKEREGDRQVPEGEYAITLKGLNPASQFHLSMNIGYPNEEDRRLGRTGGLIMIHGGCASVGCLAVGDEAIEQLYLLVEDSLRAGRPKVPVFVFPFRMTAQACSAHAGPAWHPTWDGLHEVHGRIQQFLGNAAKTGASRPVWPSRPS